MDGSDFTRRERERERERLYWVKTSYDKIVSK